MLSLEVPAQEISAPFLRHTRRPIVFLTPSRHFQSFDALCERCPPQPWESSQHALVGLQLRFLALRNAACLGPADIQANTATLVPVPGACCL